MWLDFSQELQENQSCFRNFTNLQPYLISFLNYGYRRSLHNLFLDFLQECY